MKNCRFCGKPMLPIIDILPDSDSTVEHSMWECHACPATVKEWEEPKYGFAILAFYNDHWYEVIQMYVPEGEHDDPPLTSIYKYTLYENEFEQPCVKSELALELSIDSKITPQNIQQKLAMLLVFS